MNDSDMDNEETASQGDSSFTDELASVSSEETPMELNADFTNIWRQLREVIQSPSPQVKWLEADCPKLTDLVKNCHDHVLRPYTVIVRIYPFSVFDEAEPLPPISDNRKGLTPLPSICSLRV